MKRYSCKYCKVDFDDIIEHMCTDLHQKLIKKYKIDIIYCSICDLEYYEDKVVEHMNSDFHQKKDSELKEFIHKKTTEMFKKREQEIQNYYNYHYGLKDLENFERKEKKGKRIKNEDRKSCKYCEKKFRLNYSHLIHELRECRDKRLKIMEDMDKGIPNYKMIDETYGGGDTYEYFRERVYYNTHDILLSKNKIVKGVKKFLHIPNE